MHGIIAPKLNMNMFHEPYSTLAVLNKKVQEYTEYLDVS
jgi:hypothetical protein